MNIIDAAYLTRQITWATDTFGHRRATASYLDHIRKELVEVEADPYSLEEWCDVAMLALTAAMRHGHSPQAVIDQIIAKQAINENRTWPDWRTCDPTKAIEHVREIA